MLPHTSMRRIFSYLLIAIAIMVCSGISAWAGVGNSPAAQMLESQKDAKKLEGAKFKIAKPFIKRTPMGVIIDEIDMMIICPLENMDRKEAAEVVNKTKALLKDYILVREIDDEMSRMTIYINTPQGDNFTEIVICNSRPEESIMLFSGEFTVESLVKVGEVSEQQRKHLKKNN